jgi:hypothetical protein
VKCSGSNSSTEESGLLWLSKLWRCTICCLAARHMRSGSGDPACYLRLSRRRKFTRGCLMSINLRVSEELVCAAWPRPSTTSAIRVYRLYRTRTQSDMILLQTRRILQGTPTSLLRRVARPSAPAPLQTSATSHRTRRLSQQGA